MSRNLLTARLKKLVEGGVLEKRLATSEGKRQEYCLTPMGEDLLATIVALRQWGDRWLFPGGNYPADMIDKRDNALIATVEIRSVNRRKISLGDLSLKDRSTSKVKEAKKKTE